MIGFVVFCFIILLGFVAMRRLCAGLERSERRAIALGLLAQVLGIFAIILVTKYYYGDGDMLGYHRQGSQIGRLWASDFRLTTPLVVELFLQQGGEQLSSRSVSATGSMVAISSLLALLTGGKLLPMCAIVAVAAFLSRVLIYRVLRSELAPQLRRPVLLATMFMPSVVYWSSGLLKETIALAALGPLIWGAKAVATGKHRLFGLAWLVLGGTCCGLIKGYLLVPFGVASAAWFYVRRSSKTRTGVFYKPSRLVGASLVTLLLLIVVGDLLPRYDFRRIQDQVVMEHKRGLAAEGGSNFRLTGASPSSTASMLLTAPWAVLTALLRPAIIEARNPLALMNGIETLILTMLLVQALRRRGPMSTIRLIRESSLLSFCATFCLVLALGVGFSTTNMGTLSRYRMPLVPFFVTVLIVLRENREPRESCP